LTAAGNGKSQCPVVDIPELKISQYGILLAKNFLREKK
jgi:hypothetical protein